MFAILHNISLLCLVVCTRECIYVSNILIRRSCRRYDIIYYHIEDTAVRRDSIDVKIIICSTMRVSSKFRCFIRFQVYVEHRDN